jgi:hypothetical protein
MRSTLSLLLAGLLSLLIVGCKGPDRPAWLSVNPNKWAYRSVTDEPVLLDVEGPVEVHVHSFNGDVIIKGDPKLTQAQVTVKRESTHGYYRVEEGVAALEDITWDVEIVPGELGQAISVRTRTANPEPHFQRAHVYIEAPDIENVVVRTSNGRVWVKNLRGRVDIATTEHDVRVMTNQAMTREVTIVNRNGNIDYRVRGESRGRIDAETVNGKAHGFARYGRLFVAPTTRDYRFHATLNHGENPVVLRTVNGDIHIAVVHNPEQVDVNPIP